jgi:hypothetical protein
MSPVLFKVYVLKLINLGFAKWYSGNEYLTNAKSHG